MWFLKSDSTCRTSFQ